VEGTAAAVALAIAGGADIVRVHDVKEMVRVCRVSDALVRGWRPEGWNG
jgi:dihydropteroate synthase